MAANDPNNWKDSWKDNWKGRYQGQDGYQYDRDADQSKIDKLRSAMGDYHSEYVHRRRAARKSITKLVLPSLIPVAIVALFFLWIFGII